VKDFLGRGGNPLSLFPGEGKTRLSPGGKKRGEDGHSEWGPKEAKYLRKEKERGEAKLKKWRGERSSRRLFLKEKLKRYSFVTREGRREHSAGMGRVSDGGGVSVSPVGKGKRKGNFLLRKKRGQRLSLIHVFEGDLQAVSEKKGKGREGESSEEQRKKNNTP